MPAPILFTIPNFITAGSGRAMLNIVERLDRSRFAPAVCVQKKGGDLDKVVEKMGIPFLELPFTVPARPYATLPWRVWQAARPFRPYRFALWHSFHYSDDYSEALIARMAGAHWIYTKKNMNWRRRAWLWRTRLATRVAAQNQDMMRDFFAAAPFQQKTRLIPRGVDTSKFRPGVEPRLAVRPRFHLPLTTPLIACVGQLLPVKGHPTLIEAMTYIPDGFLLLAGKPLDEPYAAALHQQVEQSGLQDRVAFLDYVQDVPALLAEADLFVLPTWAKWRQEGCPVALLEALACGKACIATDIPGSRDLIISGETGVLVPPENSQALAQAIQCLLQDAPLRQRLGAAARQRVEQHYTIEREVADHEALYAEIIGK